MVLLKWILIIVIGLLLVGSLFVTISLYWLGKNQPTTAELDLGVSNGQFSPCPETPNCVSTQADPQDEAHYAEPIPFNGNREELLALLEDWITAQEGAEVISRSENYLHAIFASKTFGFKDDLEIFIPDGSKILHLKSAARVGHSDLGVNRKRYRTIRHLVTERFSD